MRFVDRAAMLTGTTGTGTITLSAAVPGYATFSDAGLPDGSVVAYVIQQGLGWETGTGTYSASGQTLTRTLRRSSTGALLSLSGAAAVAISPGAEDLIALSGLVDVRAYGAVGNGSTDDTVAIQAAADYAATLVSGASTANRQRGSLWFPSGYRFKTTAAVTVASMVDIQMDSPIVLTATASSAVKALTIGSSSSSAESRSCRYVLDVIRATQSDWSSINDKGIVLRNICASEIHIRRSFGFCVGFQCLGDDLAFAYNHVYLGEVRGAKYSGQLSCATGFTNQNQFHGGEFANGTGEGVAGATRYGWLFDAVQASSISDNTFYGTSYELRPGGEAAEGVDVLINGPARRNWFYDQRSEGGSETRMRIADDDASFNEYHSRSTARAVTYPGYTYGGIDDQSDFKTNRVLSLIDRWINDSVVVWDSGLIAKRSNLYNGTDSYAVGGFDISDSAFNQYAAQTLIAVSRDRVTFTSSGRDLVRWIDTTVAKRFVILVDTGDASSSWNYRLKPYNAAGVLLSDNPDPPHVTGEDGSAFTWSAGIWTDGAYTSTGLVVARALYFAVGASVTKVAFGYLSAASGCFLKSMQIRSLDGQAATWIEARAPYDNGELIASAIPTKDTWLRGTRIINHTPSAGSPEGWESVTSGTEGTLAGVTGGITSGTKVLVVNTVTGLDIGQYITIAGVTGTKRIKGISGTTVNIDVNADATVAAAAVAYAAGSLLPYGVVQLANAYIPTNVTPDRAYDADTVLVAELADIVGTLLADLKAAKVLP